jgi:hypothetical protein
VLVVVGVTTAIALKPSHHVDRLTAPASFANYRRLDGAASTQVAQSLRAAGAAVPQAKAFYDAAAIAAYATNVSDQPALILIVVKASAVTGLGMTDPQSTVDDLLVASTSDNHRYPPGPHGGAMNCGTAQFGAASETVCAWSDAQTVGLLVSARPALPEAQAAQVTLAARDAVD